MMRLYVYVVKTKHFAISYRTNKPDYSPLPRQEYESTRTVYGYVKKEIPKDIPKPLGKRVNTTTFLDANLLQLFQFEQTMEFPDVSNKEASLPTPRRERC